MPKRIPTETLLTMYEEDANGCWLWTGRRNVESDYGYIGDKTPAHRWFYEQFVGPIAEGLHIDHLCRVRPCVNPEHLEAVTQAENNRRAFAARSPERVCVNGHRAITGVKCQTCARTRTREWARRKREADRAALGDAYQPPAEPRNEVGRFLPGSRVAS
jgi:HNH endonuclease